MIYKVLILVFVLISNFCQSQTKYFSKKEALQAVKKNGLEIKYVVEQYRNDKEVVVEAFLNNTRIKELYEIDLEILDLATKKLYVLYKNLSNDLLNPENYNLISPNLFRVQKFGSLLSGIWFRHHLETTINSDKELKGLTFKVIQSTKSLLKIIKLRVNHIGQIVTVGEY